MPSRRPTVNLEEVRQATINGKNHRVSAIAYWHTTPTGDLALRLHNTDIVTVRKEPTHTTIWLNSGGWYTPTTTRYMNTVPGVNAYIRQGQIMVQTADHNAQPLGKGSHPFVLKDGELTEVYSCTS